jgi:hypothetical protein
MRRAGVDYFMTAYWVFLIANDFLYGNPHKNALANRGKKYPNDKNT